MNELLFYLAQVIICSGILYGYYFIALRNRRFHLYNRYYLLAAVVISIVIPFLNIPVHFNKTEEGSSLIYQTLSAISTENIAQEIIIPQVTGKTSKSIAFPWEKFFITLYLLTGIILLARVFAGFLRIRNLINKYIVDRVDHIYFVNTDEPGTPFSFFKWLFWNKNIDLESENGQQIFRHELYHIGQKHSRDIVFMELLLVIFWFNPFFLLIKREIKTIHEFLADRFAVKENNEWKYVEVLLIQVLGTRNTPLVNPFFHNQIKRRIAMITSSKKAGYQYLRKLMVLPVAAILVAIFAFTYNENSKTEDMIIIEGNVKQIPDGKIYLTEAHRWRIILDSTVVKNGRFTFRIKTGPDFIPFMASITFPDNNLWSGLGQLIFANEYVLPSANSKLRYYHISGFYLEKGHTEITHYNSVQVPEPPSGATIIPVKIKAGKETEIMYRAEFQWPGKSVARIEKINSLKKLVKQYPFSYYLLQSIIDDRGTYTADELQKLLLLFNKDMQISKPGQQLIAYVKTGHNQGEQIYRITDTATELQNKDFLTNPMPSFRPGKTDTIKPHTKTSFYYNSKENLVLEADSLNFIPNATQMKISDFNNVLVLINGQKEETEILKKKTIISERVTFYSSSNAMAIKLLGKKAENGVVVFEGAQVLNIPPHIFYKELFAARAKQKDQDNKVFVKMDVDPHFPGGEHEWKKYLKNNLQYTVPFRKGAPTGTYTVFIQFIVDTEGSLSDIRTLTKHGFGMEEEAVRIIKSSPKWIPGSQNGRYVKAYKRQAITFVVDLENDSLEISGNNPDDFSNPRNWDYNDTAFLNWRRMAIKEVCAKSRAEGKAAYFYKGRTYVFARIDETKPPNTNSFFESDGLTKLFILNGKLIHSIEEINICYQRNDIKSLNLLFTEKAKDRYNIPHSILEIETY